MAQAKIGLRRPTPVEAQFLVTHSTPFYGDLRLRLPIDDLGASYSATRDRKQGMHGSVGLD